MTLLKYEGVQVGRVEIAKQQLKLPMENGYVVENTAVNSGKSIEVLVSKKGESAFSIMLTVVTSLIAF